MRNPTKPKLTLRLRQQLLVVLVVLIGFSLTVAVLVGQVESAQRQLSLRYASELANHESRQVSSVLDQALDAARTLAQAMAGMKAQGSIDRTSADAMLRGVLAGDPGFLGVWSGWEPDALDGQDAKYINQPGHDGSGRYIPYWNRGSGQVVLEPLLDYDKPGAGDYYLLPKQTGQETLIEPYRLCRRWQGAADHQRGGADHGRRPVPRRRRGRHRPVQPAGQHRQDPHLRQWLCQPAVEPGRPCRRS